MKNVQDALNELENCIIENKKIIKNNKIKIEEINNRKNTIIEYENAVLLIKGTKKSIIQTSLSLLIGYILGTMFISLFVDLSIISSVLVAIIVIIIPIIQNYKKILKSKKTIKSITKEKYEELKRTEEVDKKLKLSLKEECKQLKEEINLLSRAISVGEITSEMQEVRDVEENVVKNENEIANGKEQSPKSKYEQLWDEYLLSKIDYSQVPSASLELDFEQKLVLRKYNHK